MGVVSIRRSEVDNSIERLLSAGKALGVGLPEWAGLDFAGLKDRLQKDRGFRESFYRKESKAGFFCVPGFDGKVAICGIALEPRPGCKPRDFRLEEYILLESKWPVDGFEWHEVGIEKVVNIGPGELGISPMFKVSALKKAKAQDGDVLCSKGAIFDPEACRANLPKGGGVVFKPFVGHKFEPTGPTLVYVDTAGLESPKAVETGFLKGDTIKKSDLNGIFNCVVGSPASASSKPLRKDITSLLLG